MFIGQVAAARDVAAPIPECHDVMLSGLRKFALAFLLGGLSAAAAGAEPAPSLASLNSDLAQLTLRQAEIFFASRNREVQLGQRLIEGAQADRLTAAARPNPSVVASTSKFNSRQGAYGGDLRDKQMDSVFGVQQLFERGNKRELRIEAADHNIRASRGDFADIQRQQKVVLYAAYYDLVAAQEKLRIASETAGLFQKTIDAVERRLKAGDIARSDVARIRVDALRAQNDARTAQAERQKAQTALAYVIGIEREAAHINAIDAWPETSAADGALEIEKALAGRADVQAAQARVAAAEKVRELARSLRTRDVTGLVQFEHFPGDFSNNTFGVGVSIPLFTGYYFEGEIRRAEVELQAARDNYERVRALALGEIVKSRADLDAAHERVQRFRESLLKEAQKAADAAEFAYSRGAIGVMDLLDARRQLYATRLEASSTQADYAKSLAAWQAAIAAVEITQQ
jgi:cobalt-zinc-cadmium efflux system outer membrane protein